MRSRTRPPARSICVLASLATALTLVAACGAGKAGNGKTNGTAKQITVAVSDSPSATALKAIAPAYTKKTGVKVKFVDLPYNQLAAKVLLASKKASDAYDVIQFDSPMLASLAAGGALADIGAKAAGSAAYDYADFPAAVQDYAKYQNKTYALPLSTEPYVLWYRTDLFRKLALKPPATWEEYLTNAKKLKAAGHSGSDSGFGSQIGAYYWLESIYASGGSLLQANSCNSALRTPAAIDATKAYLAALPYTPATAVNGGGNEMTTAFVQTDVGQEINATGYYSIMADPKQSKVPGKFAADLPPSLTGAQRATLLFGWLIGVGRQSKAQQTAWQFLEFALGKDSSSSLISNGAPPPARTSLLNDAKAKSALPYLPTLVAAAKVGQHLPYITQMPQIISTLSADLSNAATKHQSADTLTKAADTDLKKILSGASSCT